jgi:hypothetical protein
MLYKNSVTITKASVGRTGRGTSLLWSCITPGLPSKVIYFFTFLPGFALPANGCSTLPPVTLPLPDVPSTGLDIDAGACVPVFIFHPLIVMPRRRLRRVMMLCLACLVGLVVRQQQGLHRQVVPYLAARQRREPYLLLGAEAASLLSQAEVLA